MRARHYWPPMHRDGDDNSALVLRVRAGELEAQGSWIYAWLRVGAERPVVYVGATGLHPATRAWLHLHHEDPDVGRVAAAYPTRRPRRSTSLR